MKYSSCLFYIISIHYVVGLPVDLTNRLLQDFYVSSADRHMNFTLRFQQFSHPADAAIEPPNQSLYTPKKSYNNVINIYQNEPTTATKTTPPRSDPVTPAYSILGDLGGDWASQIEKATKYNLQMKRMDVVTAYLHSELEEEVFVKPPKEITSLGQCGKLGRLDNVEPKVRHSDAEN